MVQSRGGKTGDPARWVTRCVPKPITMRTNNSYIPLRLLGRRTMQPDGKTNVSHGLRGEWQRVPRPRKTSGAEWDEVPVGCTIRRM